MLPKIFRQNNIDSFFDDFTFGAPFGLSRRSEEKNEWNGLMRMDIRESGEGYSADIDLPGCRKEGISIELNNGYLTVSAGRSHESEEKGEGGYIRRERFSGRCSRSIFIGGHVRREDVKARFENGVLSLSFPKEESEARKSSLIDIEG